MLLQQKPAEQIHRRCSRAHVHEYVCARPFCEYHKSDYVPVYVKGGGGLRWGVINFPALRPSTYEQHTVTNTRGYTKYNTGGSEILFSPVMTPPPILGHSY